MTNNDIGFLCPCLPGLLWSSGYRRRTLGLRYRLGRMLGQADQIQMEACTQARLHNIYNTFLQVFFSFVFIFHNIILSQILVSVEISPFFSSSKFSFFSHGTLGFFRKNLFKGSKQNLKGFQIRDKPQNLFGFHVELVELRVYLTQF